MKLKNKISRVFKFSVLDKDTVAYISDDKLFVIKNQKQIDIKTPKVSRILFKVGKYLFVSESEPDGMYVYDYQNEFTFFLLDFILNIPISLENRRTQKYFYPNVSRKDIEAITGKMDIVTPNNLASTYPINYGGNGVWLVLSERYFLSLKNPILKCLHFETGSIKWEIDFSEIGASMKYDGRKIEGEVTNLYHTSDEVIVVELSQKGIAGVSADTGEILWQVNKDVEPVEPTLYNGVFYGFAEFYYEIDGVTGKLLRQESYKESFAQNSFRDYWLTVPCVTEDLIAITSHYDNAILLLDKATLNVIQRIQIEGSKNGLALRNSPQIHGNSLYQLDGDNTLHIFDISTVLN
ncbi:outer membrane protein assembly factor BamB family protein [Arcicella lustrica]|uniref:PQQ-binding-like beta-propeller repeat protein n=1 Tax=Arcicella lustrica TaxID=2984196 RepID=A0ABU5SIA5_9BACT|nr:PQQ-binding-like beta-propeller repeat protein [Arcicella sp. DC25W]MEA5426990.1 PQQ-binding-like beta-propeller repeat protein [Arcicella sp. DC25W]